MKKTITSAGLVVLGAATLQAQRTVYAPAPGLSSTELAKPWSISASVRGFYDDNYATQPSHDAFGNKNPAKDDAYGFEVSPAAAFNWTLAQTYLGLSYQYGLKWYDDRPGRDYDQMHQASGKLSHAFTERYKIDLSDTFVSAQEPELLEPFGAGRLRSEGDNIRNTANATFSADVTDQFGLVFGYTNNYYDYDQRGTGSYSALLDRMEHLGSINARWQVIESTVAIFGYQYGVIDYNSPDLLSPLSTLKGEDRDSSSHYVYVGADHNFNSQLQASVRVGAQFTEYDKFDEDTVTPYADASLTYRYNPESYALFGVRHSRNATDVASLSGGAPTLDQETTTLYGSVNHQITGKLSASALAQAQFSRFQAGSVDDEAELFFLSGVNLSYEINKYLAAEVGYNYDRLDSDIALRSYTRNRVYIGLRASY
ncbi:MAG: outer membrane beta-barrel protein [Verrucomicrobiales bacterium]|nr:outer membrane beta-barrel protein [Verrucomicrobiales bacterium]